MNPEFSHPKAESSLRRSGEPGSKFSPRIYPIIESDPDSVLGQDLLNLTTANLLSWKQGVGAFGQLHLHACWGESSSLRRRYHGDMISHAFFRIRGMMQLYERTLDQRWRWQADDIAAQVLHLQAPDGGFIHAANEFEPSYTSSLTCPIHQGLGALALLCYAEWPHAWPERRNLIREALQRHFAWLCKNWWLRGNVWTGPLPQAGFCGVSNQDLVVVAAMAKYAAIYGDDEYFQRYGKPTLNLYISPRYYHESLGLFERGDKPNFVERTGYHYLVITMLEIAHAATGDARLPSVIDNTCRHLFDAVHEEADGLLYLAWGAQTYSEDKGRVAGWDLYPHVMTDLAPLLENMAAYLQRHPDGEKEAVFRRLEKTLAAHVYSDGTQPLNLRGEDPLFRIACTFSTPLWYYAILRLGDRLQNPSPVVLPTVHRRCRNIVWKTNQTMWSIEVDGRREFAGLKANESGISIGPDEVVYGADFSLLDEPDVVEHVVGD